MIGPAGRYNGGGSSAATDLLCASITRGGGRNSVAGTACAPAGFPTGRNMDWAAIDVSNVVWWKFHSTARRDPLLAVIQAVTHVPVLCDELGCERVAFCHDRAPYKRRQVWPQYKTHRDKHPGEDSSAEDELRAYIAKIPDYLRLLGYRNVFARPGYEADDLMWAVRQAVPAGDRLVMVSGDGDLFQLLDGRTASYRPRTGHGWTP